MKGDFDDFKPEMEARKSRIDWGVKTYGVKSYI
jgi:hypothetical protein